MTPLACRFCQASLDTITVDLGMSPLSNAYVPPERLRAMEPFYPLCAYVCTKCFLVQIEAVEKPEHVFADYAYFSSYSTSWLAHAERYAGQMVEALGLGADHLVVEVASNDGYLLQYFRARGIPVLGIEPAANVALVAEAKGVPSIARFFGAPLARELAASGRQADLLVGNNVLAHVPDLNGFVEGLAIALKPAGVITMEFPHLLRLMEENQFDTIYHEHFSYLSLQVVEDVFATHGLVLYDVAQLPTHGGSLRIFARHAANTARHVAPAVAALRAREQAAGLRRLETYAAYGERVAATKRDILTFLIEARRDGKQVVGYGAPAKGNTLLNYCGVRTDLLAYTVDVSPHKQGKFLPGTHIPIASPDRLRQTRPDYVLILPWNLSEEITAQHAYIADWGGQFVVPIPSMRILG